MTAILGMRGTGDFPADHRPLNWREKFLMLQPNGSAPLTAILSMLPAEATDDPVFYNFRKEWPSHTFLHSGTALAGDVTLTATVASALTYVRIGHLIRNFRTGEVAKVTGKPAGNQLTVTRGIGNGGTGIAVNASDVWFVVGDANPEGADTPDAYSWDAASTFNHTQIFRTPVRMTRTAIKTNFRTGDQYKEKVRDALTVHMTLMERAMLWGKRDSITGANGEPERYTGGIISFLSSNVLDVGAGSAGVLDEQTFDTYLAEKVFAFGSAQKLGLVGWRVADNLNRIAKGRWQVQSMGTSGGSYGVSFTSYMTPFGELVIKTHPQFRDIPGAENMMLVLDTKDLRFRYIDDTALLKDRQSPGIDGVTDEYLTEAGLEMLQEKTHALITGWTSVG